MIGRLNHVAIAVRDMSAAAQVYRDIWGPKYRTACRCRRMA